MAKYVLVSDSSLSASYRDFPLLEFLPSAPAHAVPNSIYYFLKGPLYDADSEGRSKITTYALRKLEAALLQRNSRSDVVVAHEDHLGQLITDDTEIIAVNTMDPLGIGPLTMSYFVLMGAEKGAWVAKEWRALMAKINAARKGKKAKLVVGGPGVWEFTIHPEELDAMNIDYAFQGESEDVICDLFEQLSAGSLDKNEFFEGYMTIDDDFHRSYVSNPKFISRNKSIGTSVPLEKIPLIQGPVHSGMVEIMRGCGIGCDFCEVTLRPLRYYTNEMIRKEIEVNVKLGGFDNAWLHTDEFFGFRHTKPTFEPNEEALIDLVTNVMSIKGVRRTNPTHARISPAAAYPELIEKLSRIMKAGLSNWIGVQVGVETGSDILAKKHMPNKTLPLKIGADGSWSEIVWRGTRNMNKYYWRPAFTIQSGQRDETPEDNWDTVALINKMSNSYVDRRPLEFTITPMQNVPLGLIKSKGFSVGMLTESQFAMYYASYRHLYKMALRNARRESKGNPVVKMGTASVISLGGWVMMKFVEKLARKAGVDIEKVKRYGLTSESEKIETLVEFNKT
ncbi:MAG: B12-binding domain-containing radical SAM protein [Candidatus Marsarchaeota archaeon]|nr:B12-binding domain-containing radical SAM protein [Candidatus Marsarchaeota archaeon]